MLPEPLVRTGRGRGRPSSSDRRRATGRGGDSLQGLRLWPAQPRQLRIRQQRIWQQWIRQ